MSDAAEQTAEPGLQADADLVARGWMRIGIGLAVAGQAMVFGLAINVTPADGVGYWVVHGGLMLSALLVLIFLGGDMVGAAWRSLREARISIDLLFLVTLTGALAGSLVSTFTRTGAVYYEVVAVLIAVHTLGKLIGARSRLAALSAVDKTRAQFASVRVREPDGREVTKPVKALRGDERVLVAPGEAIAVDGTIVRGRSYISETSMTGEWRPVPRGEGEAVLAGTHAVDGDLEIAPTIGARRLDHILSEVERARVAPSALQAQADTLMRFFLPVVVTVSVGTFAFWWLRGPWPEALFNAMAVLLVACPCAMGLATPIAVWSGLARLVKLGVVARTGDLLDALGRCDQLCIDKTGTLSEERMEVLAWRMEGAWTDPASSAWLRGAVARLEDGLMHPVAQALVSAGGGDPGSATTMTEREVVAGGGVRGRVDGRQVAVGEWDLHGFTGDAPSGAAKAVWVSVDGALAATVELGERWRVGLTETLAELRELGVAVEVLTGDRHPPTDLGVPVEGGLSPEDKVARIAAHQAAGRQVVFVGDGVNDAAAMGVANGSIAVGGGADLARASAMGTMAGDDLRVVPRAIRLGRVVRRGIYGNLRFAACYNVTGMILAASGWLHPVVAAFLMVGSSIAVGVRALRAAEKVTVE
ncbi:heavy metal translocating P-type ATPase [Actomonas aquatica]|uniref:Heavy metal translocating P-type ATPase n=1 Tax=Actomonas aquatica TaxID=2866162 RepID=A0ABZ1CCP0_9BACT|nr:heavy metal translocating P-type ATPase [Opitutus sp. WL0086]WRQ89442.1 heavy metal translocating P-type ATPase [Opitutus sp. WL0086]